ncbi:hypothetical protein [Ferruginibacter sp. HRS2-29]|uniref:hypothetical protein n=1 Tax=Ferruginibacter sp. HRS2-29 TaxID=2487334 RepID=UPI0020CEE7A9|nr:hypothetical protein [Ferruginibacter sp. HRS2-29]
MTSTKHRIHFIFSLFIVVAGFIPQQVFAQDITGIWKGTITTTEKELPYELAISEADGKLVGYSYVRFTVNGKEMSAVKSIKVKNNDGQVTVEDDDLIYDNFQQSAPKDVKQVSKLVLKVEGDVMTMAGPFKTKATRQFRVLSGKITLQKVDTSAPTALHPALDSMKLWKDLSFLQPEKPVFGAVVNKPVAKTDLRNSLPKDSTGSVAKMTIQSSGVARKIETEPVVEEKAVPATPPPVAVITPPVVASPVVKKPQPVATPPVAVAKPVTQTPPPVQKSVVTAPVASAPAKPAPVLVRPNITGPDFTANLAKRSIETIKTLEIKTDSLTLTLYDNGEVDGDTVSVILNGKILMAKQGLSTNAINKTIYITPEMGDSIQLVMYAENLGSLPPNTGLLIIRDGAERYEIRFSGDLTKNAGITLRRRKSQ